MPSDYKKEMMREFRKEFFPQFVSSLGEKTDKATAIEDFFSAHFDAYIERVRGAIERQIIKITYTDAEIRNWTIRDILALPELRSEKK